MSTERQARKEEVSQIPTISSYLNANGTQYNDLPQSTREEAARYAVEDIANEATLRKAVSYFAQHIDPKFKSFYHFAIGHRRFDYDHLTVEGKPYLKALFAGIWDQCPLFKGAFVIVPSCHCAGIVCVMSPEELKDLSDLDRSKFLEHWKPFTGAGTLGNLGTFVDSVAGAYDETKPPSSKNPGLFIFRGK